MKLLKGHTNDVTSVGFSPNGTRIVSGSGDGTTRIWDTKTGEEVMKFTFGYKVNAVGFSPDGTHIVSSSLSGFGVIQIWDAMTGKS
jgi:WD40 repeat protein